MIVWKCTSLSTSIVGVQSRTNCVKWEREVCGPSIAYFYDNDGTLNQNGSLLLNGINLFLVHSRSSLEQLVGLLTFPTALLRSKDDDIEIPKHSRVDGAGQDARKRGSSVGLGFITLKFDFQKGIKTFNSPERRLVSVNLPTNQLFGFCNQNLKFLQQSFASHSILLHYLSILPSA